jgi:hypothetical protein
MPFAIETIEEKVDVTILALGIMRPLSIVSI